MGSAVRGFFLPLFVAGIVGIGATIVAAAANPQDDRAISDHSSRELLVARDAMRDERIDTTARGQVQLLFADQSSLSIAPHSDVVVNEFRFDPQTHAGKLTATVTSGLLRYVGGQISKGEDVAFYTPGAAVLVRGGIILIKTERDIRGGGATTHVLFLAGDRMCVYADGRVQCTTKFGTAITSENGEPPSEPVLVTPAMIQGLFRDLQAADAGEPGPAGSETIAGGYPPRHRD